MYRDCSFQHLYFENWASLVITTLVPWHVAWSLPYCPTLFHHYLNDTCHITNVPWTCQILMSLLQLVQSSLFYKELYPTSGQVTFISKVHHIPSFRILFTVHYSCQVTISLYQCVSSQSAHMMLLSQSFYFTIQCIKSLNVYHFTKDLLSLFIDHQVKVQT